MNHSYEDLLERTEALFVEIRQKIKDLEVEGHTDLELYTAYVTEQRNLLGLVARLMDSAAKREQERLVRHFLTGMSSRYVRPSDV